MSDQPILPELENLLVRAARHRATPRFKQRRWILAAAVVGALALVAAAAAATSVILASGETDGGTFTIQARQVPHPKGDRSGGSICLQLTFSGRGSAYGCGSRPTAGRPFGLVIADPLDGGDDRVVYGLVSEAVKRVRVLVPEGSLEAETEENQDLWGRFFYAVTPSEGPLQLVGYNGAGQLIARLGNAAPRSGTPRSKAEARRQGDPAGFAPAVTPPETYLYRGQIIKPVSAKRRGLACIQGRAISRCFDSEAEAEADQQARP